MVRLDDLSQVGDAVKKLNPGIFQDVGEGVKKKRNKYGNIRTSMEGMSFDSGKESVDAGNFMLAVRGGAYIAYLHHVNVTLPSGNRLELDHLLIDKQMKVQIFDSKAWDVEKRKFIVTEAWKNKAREFKLAFGIEIQVI